MFWHQLAKKFTGFSSFAFTSRYFLIADSTRLCTITENRCYTNPAQLVPIGTAHPPDLIEDQRLVGKGPMHGLPIQGVFFRKMMIQRRSTDIDRFRQTAHGNTGKTRLCKQQDRLLQNFFLGLQIKNTRSTSISTQALNRDMPPICSKSVSIANHPATKRS